MNRYSDLVQDLTYALGGGSNIAAISHGLTRLYVTVHDDGKVDSDAIKKTNGVISTLHTVDRNRVQYHIVVGPQASTIYASFIKENHLENLVISSPVQQKTSWFNRILSVLNGVFVPMMGVLCASGILKCILTILHYIGLFTPTSGTYIILQAASDTLFYFLPVVVGYTAAKEFDLDPVIGIVLGLILCAPAMVGISPSVFANGLDPRQPLGYVIGIPYYIKVFSIPVVMPSSGNYTGAVIPVILIIWLASIVEKKLKALISSSVKVLFTPLIVIVVSLTAGIIVLGPVSAFLTEVVGKVISTIFTHVPVLGGILVGGLWQILVIFGLHWSLIALHLLNLVTNNYDVFVTPYFAASFAQIAAVLAIYYKTKDIQIKNLTAPAVISALFGITEPAIYGITLPLKTPFVFSCIGAAVGGAIIAITKTASYITGSLGIFGFSTFMMTDEYCKRYQVGPSFDGLLWAVLSVVVAMIITFTLVMLFYKKTDGAFDIQKVLNAHFSRPLYAPLSGIVVPLNKIEDEAFRTGMLGEGCAIIPDTGVVIAPCDAVVTAIPEYRHAVGLLTSDGVEILIHVGMNTIDLKGRWFTSHVHEGQIVQQGDVLIEFDSLHILAAGYSTVTPIVISNSEKLNAKVVLDAPENEKVSLSESLLHVNR